MFSMRKRTAFSGHQSQNLAPVLHIIRCIQTKIALTYRSVMCWNKCLKETESILWQHGPPCHTESQDNVKQIHEAFQRSPHKSVCQARSQLGLPCSTVHDVLHKMLKLHAYKLQLCQKMCVCGDQSTDTTVLYGEANVLMMLLNMNMIHWRSMCGISWLQWRTLLCVISCRNCHPVTWCTTSLLWLCLSRQEVSWPMDRKKGTHFLAPSFSIFQSSRFPYTGGVQKTLFIIRSANVNELHDRIIRAAECVTDEMLVKKLNIILMCNATNGAHTEIY